MSLCQVFFAIKILIACEELLAKTFIVVQLIECNENIGWRSESTKVIIYLSDATPHIAGDGALAGKLD